MKNVKEWCGSLAVFAVVIAACVGWVVNIITLFHMTAILSGEGIIRIIGIFVAPLGAIMGYF